jgi:Pentapeptide repeats (8 copies)
MRNPYGRGKIEDRPTPSRTHDYRVPLGERLLGSELRIALVVFVVLSSGLFRRLNRNGITSIFLANAVFDELDLRGDGEPWATKRGVDLSGSYAVGASFVGSALTGLSLRDANLQQCRFNDAYCGKVDFRGAVLIGADFTNAILTWADFTGAKHLLATQLAKARNLHGAVLGERLEAEIRELNPAVFEREKWESPMKEFFEMLDPHQLAEDLTRGLRKDQGNDTKT